jgi:hypothetical protein
MMTNLEKDRIFKEFFINNIIIKIDAEIDSVKRLFLNIPQSDYGKNLSVFLYNCML